MEDTHADFLVLLFFKSILMLKQALYAALSIALQNLVDHLILNAVAEAASLEVGVRFSDFHNLVYMWK